ncbi:MAG: S-layer homology domain-containing protein [Oscillospiraceae bacterium]|nr:S-layer homology domain-containing protein [Oscillospiraceae bacterium]
MKKRLVAIMLALALMLGLASAASAATASPGSSKVSGSAAYMYGRISAPSYGSEWAILGIARSGYSVPDKYYQDYYAAVEQYVKDKKGVLSTNKYTDYSRTVIALAAIGKDATNVGGYDLVAPLADYEKVLGTGLNGPIWALIALNSRGYSMPTAPAGKTQATKQMYVDRIVNSQLDDGGWNLNSTPTSKSGSADADITGMALQALAKYQSQTAVKNAVDKALDCLSKMQNDDGTFQSFYVSSTCESTAQIVVGLCECGVSLTDSRFVKNGKSALDGLMSYRNSNGSFLHSREESGDNAVSSEQGLYALVAAQRAASGKNSLYSMGDAITVSTPAPQAYGLPGKDPAVQQVPVTAAGKTFPDISGHKNKAAIEALAARGIINGGDGGLFRPDNTMTRAEFAAITVRALGMAASSSANFTDVPSSQWYAGWIGTATSYGIVNGYGDGNFGPNDTISREQAAAMVARAAKLCGMNTDYSDAAARDVLAQFGDYTSVSGWARGSLAFCYDQGILDASAKNIQPQALIKRCEIAQMLYNMLNKAKLL